MHQLLLKWPGLTAFDTLIISVEKREFGIDQAPIEFAGKQFKPKGETHITVFGSSIGAPLARQMAADPALEERIAAAFEETDWSYTVTEEFCHLVRPASGAASLAGTEESIIVLLALNGMAVFFDKLKAMGLLADSHPVPPPHVTLYTHNCDTGIGVHSEKELEELTRQRVNRLD